MIKNICIVLILAAGLCGCATAPGFMGRSYGAEKIISQGGFDKEYIDAAGFKLMTCRRFKTPCDSMRIYIEGDGRAWETRSRLSDDPTPSDPVALELAAEDPSDCVAYIARPGQFPASDSTGCDPTYWSQRRFSTEVVESFNKTIDILKSKSSAKKIELVGYSGGAAIAVLVAAGRSDVSSLRTVAGNLSTRELCAYHKVSPLDGSLDPLDFAQKISNIPQRHFVGRKDKTVPASIVESFVRREGYAGSGRIAIIEGASHKDGWREHWKELLSEPVN